MALVVRPEDVAARVGARSHSGRWNHGSTSVPVRAVRTAPGAGQVRTEGALGAGQPAVAAPVAPLRPRGGGVDRHDVRARAAARALHEHLVQVRLQREVGVVEAIGAHTGRLAQPSTSAARASGRSPWMEWPARSTATTSASGRRRSSSATSASSTTGDVAPRASRSGPVRLGVAEHVPQVGQLVGGLLALDGVHPHAVVAPGPGAVGQRLGVVEHAAAEARLRARRVELRSSARGCASKDSNVSGPDTKAMMSAAFSRLTPGVTSTSSSRRTRSGRRPASAAAVSPPRLMPTTTVGVGRQRRDRLGDGRGVRPTGGSRARRSSRSGRGRGGRRRGSAGSRARATVSHVCAFWAPPCSEHDLGRVALLAPHDGRRRRRPSTRRTGSGSRGMPASEAFSWSRPNSS